MPGPVLQGGAGLIDLWNRVQKGTPLVDGTQARLGRYFLYFDGSKAARELGLPQSPAHAAVEEAWYWYQAHGLL
jgi:dihydroflavonol-4-reductase